MAKDKDGKGNKTGDALLWRRVAETVRPLAKRRPAPVFPPDFSVKRLQSPAVPVATRAPVLSPKPVAPPPLAPGQAPGLDKSTHDKLKRGQLAIEAKLDLHGMDRERAHRALDGFLERAADQGRRCVLVVTGKGGPRGSEARPGAAGVLKTEVPRWLNEPRLRARILAIAPAQPKHGGGGALYVLLKRRRDG